MKKILLIMIAFFFLISPVEALAKSYEVNSFYAIRSYPEYEKIQELLGDSNNIYYGWSRIARDLNGSLIFTEKKVSLSKYDLYSNDYSVPEPVNGKLTNEINKNLHPGSQNLMMLFFNKITYDDGRNSIIDFLNMDNDSWEKDIINPMINSMNTYGFDGIVLDIEGIADSFTNVNYPAEKNSGLKEKYNAFLGQVKSRLQGKKLVVCVNMPEFGGYDYSFIYNTADQCLLLAYPYQHYNTYSESDGVPDLIGKIKEVDVPEAAPYSMIKENIDDITSVIKQQYGTSYNPQKLLLGTTIEVTGWIEKEYTYQSKTYSYFEKTSTLDEDNNLRISTLEGIEALNVKEEYIGVSPVYKYESRTSRKVLTTGLDSGMKKVEFYYETPETIYEKYYKLVSDYGLSGISVWRLGLGDYSTVDSIFSSMNDLFSIYKGEFDELPNIADVPLNKTWTVKFNIPLNETTIKSAKDNIAIVDVYGKLLPVSYNYDKISNSVTVSPSVSYKPGCLYYLIIGKNMKSEGGSSLLKPVIIRFKTK